MDVGGATTPERVAARSQRVAAHYGGVEPIVESKSPIALAAPN
jgi:hypothetical protein